MMAVKSDETEAWITRANTAMIRGYCIDLEGAGLDRNEVVNFRKMFSEPEDFVEWFVAKHNLTSVADVNFGRPIAPTKNQR
jgi:hypothetical protein